MSEQENCPVLKTKHFVDPELSKISLEKDSELSKISLEKDSELSKISLEKDSELSKISLEKDSELSKISLEKDSELSKIFLEKDSDLSEISNASEPSISINCIKESKTSSGMPEKGFENFDINMDESASIFKTDSKNHILESTRLVELDLCERSLSENNSVVVSNLFDVDVDNELINEKFFDANQFFNNPSSLDYLEHAGSSKPPSESSLARSSLYQKFDPLHAKFFPQFNTQSGEQQVAVNESESKLNNLENLLTCDNFKSTVETDESLKKSNGVPIGGVSDKLQSNAAREAYVYDSQSDYFNKPLLNVNLLQSSENMLISFDLPNNDTQADFNLRNVKHSDEKKYTEGDLQEALKAKELAIQETCLKRQQEFDIKFEQKMGLANSLLSVINEVGIFIPVASENVTLLKEKLEIVEKENVKLQEDLKTANEEVQSTENAFCNFQKRYDRCKNMLKVYSEIENSLYQQIEYVNKQLIEKEEMYKALQLETEALLDKASTESNNLVKANEAHIAVLKAQLRIAEMKINSLENDLNQIKHENEKLNSICDGLKAKISET